MKGQVKSSLILLLQGAVVTDNTDLLQLQAKGQKGPDFWILESLCVCLFGYSERGVI